MLFIIPTVHTETLHHKQIHAQTLLATTTFCKHCVPVILTIQVFACRVGEAEGLLSPLRIVADSTRLDLLLQPWVFLIICSSTHVLILEVFLSYLMVHSIHVAGSYTICTQ